jgi:hypothetical protein
MPKSSASDAEYRGSDGIVSGCLSLLGHCVDVPTAPGGAVAAEEQQPI